MSNFLHKNLKEKLLITLFLVAYVPIILWMWERWFEENSYYSHGVLVPFVSLFLILGKKDILQKLTPNPSRWGFRLFTVGILIYWISASLHIYFSAGFSMLLVILGLILHLYGEKTLKEVLFPILFLIFMIPLPLILVATFSFKLKILAAQLATFVLNEIRLPAIQLASLIKMSHTYVVVEDACGGLKSLISLTALGSLFAYQIKTNSIKKTILFVSAIPIAVLTNAARIVFLAAIGEIWGIQYAQGFLHHFSGYLVFTFAFLLLFAIKELLE